MTLPTMAAAWFAWAFLGINPLAFLRHPPRPVDVLRRHHDVGSTAFLHQTYPLHCGSYVLESSRAPKCAETLGIAPR
jgi:hypothetical protein